MSETTTVKWTAEFLQTIKQDDHIVAFVWTKKDAEQITGQDISDEEWQVLAETISRKADWLHNEMHEEFIERLQQLREVGD